MKIIDAISRIDDLMRNTYSQTEKVEWLSRLDNMVKKQIIDTHEGSENVAFNGYNASTPMDTVLLVPAPYDEVYLKWIEAQIHYYNGEYDKYNNAIIMFNTDFEAYAAHYNQDHRPVNRGRRFLF